GRRDRAPARVHLRRARRASRARRFPGRRSARSEPRVEPRMIPEAQRLPCRRCGAPLARVESAPSLPVVARCAWCGEEEVLPSEPAERARALQILRAQRAWADAATRGMSASLVPLASFGGALRWVGPTLAFGVLTSALSVVVFGALPAGVLPSMGAFVGL